MRDEERKALADAIRSVEDDDVILEVVAHESWGTQMFVAVPKENAVKMVERYGAAWELHDTGSGVLLTPVGTVLLGRYE